MLRKAISCDSNGLSSISGVQMTQYCFHTDVALLSIRELLQYSYIIERRAVFYLFCSITYISRFPSGTESEVLLLLVSRRRILCLVASRLSPHPLPHCSIYSTRVPTLPNMDALPLSLPTPNPIAIIGDPVGQLRPSFVLSMDDFESCKQFVPYAIARFVVLPKPEGKCCKARQPY